MRVKSVIKQRMYLSSHIQTCETNKRQNKWGNKEILYKILKISCIAACVVRSGGFPQIISISNLVRYTAVFKTRFVPGALGYIRISSTLSKHPNWYSQLYKALRKLFELCRPVVDTAIGLTVYNCL